MKILILNGSPRERQNTVALIEAFSKGAKSSGHDVMSIDIAKKNITGCIACEYCHTKGNGKCVKKDDMEKVCLLIQNADMLVLASPIYYFTMTAQLQACIQRIYCIDHPEKVTQMALLLSSASPGTHDGAIAEYKGLLKYFKAQDRGIVIAVGDENKTPEKLEEARKLGASVGR